MNCAGFARTASALLALGLLLGVGYRLGRDSARPAASSPVVAAPAAADGAVGRASSAAAKPKPALILSAELHELDGRAFVDALPELERRARGGDSAAASALFYKLQGCAGHVVESEREVRAGVEAWYQRQLDMAERLRAQDPAWQPSLDLEAQREQQLRWALDKRERCSALAPVQVENRIEWAKLAIEQGDHGMIIALGGMGSFSMEGSEVVRNTERLLELRERERAALDRLIEAGDLEAIQRAAHGYAARDNLSGWDPERAYAYAHAWQLAAAGADAQTLTYHMERLAAESLSLSQIEQARRQGEALYQRCCRAVVPNAH